MTGRSSTQYPIDGKDELQALTLQQSMLPPSPPQYQTPNEKVGAAILS
jgi:hypothetical protein